MFCAILGALTAGGLAAGVGERLSSPVWWCFVPFVAIVGGASFGEFVWRAGRRRGPR